MLMPRLIARRFTANAVLRFPGPTAEAMAVRLAGRKSSETMAQRTVATATRERRPRDGEGEEDEAGEEERGRHQAERPDPVAEAARERAT